MIVRINRVVLNSSGNVYRSSEAFIVTCTNDELESIVKPKLDTLANIDNLRFIAVGSGDRIKYECKLMHTDNIDSFKQSIAGLMDLSIGSTNQGIHSRNDLVRKANKKYGVAIDTNCKPLIKNEDYMDMESLLIIKKQS